MVCASSFTDVEFSSFDTVNDVYNVVRQAFELFRDVYPGLRASDVGLGANEGICSTLCFVAWSGPWCSCDWLTQLRWHPHATDVRVCDIRLRNVRLRQMVHMDVPEKESRDGGPICLDLPSQGHSSVPVHPGRPSRGHPSGSFVSGTSVWILRLGLQIKST